MKKIFSFLIVALLFVLTACASQDSSTEQKSENRINEKEKENNVEQGQVVTNEDVREKVWEQLSQSQKENIRGTWKDAKIQKITLKSGMGKIEKVEYIGKEVYIVEFPKNESINGLLVYADVSENEIIGFGYSD